VFLLASNPAGVAGITAGAALFVAFVTAWTTNRRQDQQLAAEAKRQRGQLAAEADRQQRELEARRAEQKEQLDHDRELADLGDVRAVLDEATLALESAGAAWRSARSRAEFNEIDIRLEGPDVEVLVEREETDTERDDRLARDDEKLMSNIKEVITELERVSAPLAGCLARLRVRLGATHPITSAFDDAKQATTATYRNVHGLAPTRFMDEAAGRAQKIAAIEDTKSSVEKAFSSYTAFQEAAVELAGSSVREHPR
jgi:hypothetical protein